MRPALEQAVEPLFAGRRASASALRTASGRVAQASFRIGAELVPYFAEFDIDWQVAMAMPEDTRARAKEHLTSPAAHFDYLWTCAALAEFMHYLIPAAQETIRRDVAAQLVPARLDAADLAELQNDPLLQAGTLVTAVGLAVADGRAPERASQLAILAFEKMQAFLASPAAGRVDIAPHLRGTKAQRAEWHRLALAATGPIPAEVLDPLGD